MPGSDIIGAGADPRLAAQLISKTDCYMRGVFLPADINQNGDSFGGESATALCLLPKTD